MANRSKTLKVRVTPEEHKKITRKAKQASMSASEFARIAFIKGDIKKNEYNAIVDASKREGLSGYLRATLEAAVVHPRHTPEETKALFRLSEIANRIRQKIEKDPSLGFPKDLLEQIDIAIEQLLDKR